MHLRTSLIAAALLSSAGACSSSNDSPSARPVDAPDGGAPSSPDASTVARDGAIVPPPSSDGSPSPDASGPPDSAPAGPPAKQSLIWVWQGYADALASIEANAASFTHVSPAFYQVNYEYTSGAPRLLNANDDFDGLSSAQFTQRVHAAGMKCVPLMYGGAGNYGTDQGIQNILNDAPPGTQNAFITAMVSEAQAKGYDGYNLDWEVSTTGYGQYGTKLVSFLGAFTTALHAHQMTLSLDLGGWYVRQCAGSGGDGLVDLAALGHSVDLAIYEDYAGALGSPSACPSSPPNSQDCDGDFAAALGVMCNVPDGVASIGLISTGSNGFADQALAAAGAYGYRNVAVWPDDAVFLNGAGMKNGATWYSVLADFLKH